MTMITENTVLIDSTRVHRFACSCRNIKNCWRSLPVQSWSSVCIPLVFSFSHFTDIGWVPVTHLRCWYYETPVGAHSLPGVKDSVPWHKWSLPPHAEQKVNEQLSKWYHHSMWSVIKEIGCCLREKDSLGKWHGSWPTKCEDGHRRIQGTAS